MSLRKLISLLLLVSFVFTTVSPAFATTTVNQNGVTLPTLAEDDGTVASQGANLDVVPLTLEIRAGSGEITFGGDSGLVDPSRNSSAENGQFFITDGNGKLFVKEDGALQDLDTPQYVAAFAAPAGTKFVRLTSASYNDTTVNGSTNYLGAVNGTALLRNITVSATSPLPGGGTTNGAIIVASVLDEQASTDIFGATNAALLPAGSLVLNFLSPIGGDQTTSNSLIVNVTGVGLASDGTGSLADSGNIAVKYIKATGTNGAEALTGFSSGSTSDGGNNTMNVATLAPSGNKLEAILVGTKTGNDGATVVAEPDAQSNSLLASAVTGTIVTVGPGEITGGGTSGKLDTDAIVIRAKERPDSTASAVTYYQTPFETSKFVLAAALANNGTDADTLQTTSVADSNVFPNQDAVITVVFSLETAAGGTSSATLAINAANVTLHGARAFNSIRGAGATLGGQTTSIADPLGFLGAAINLENGSTSDANHSVVVLYNGASSITNYDLADVNVLNYAVVAAKHGTTPAFYTAEKRSSTVIANGTTALGVFPGSLIHNGEAATQGGFNLVNTANGTVSSTALAFSASFDATNPVDNASSIATPSDLTARLVNGTAGASIGNTAYYVLTGNDAGAAMNSTGDRIAVAATNPGAKPYHEGFTAQSVAEANNPEDNLIAAAELEGTTLKIIPVINKYDGIRDAISIRPEATITLDAAAKTAGVKLIATISGNNIASSTRVVLATLVGGNVTTPIDVTATALPTHGVQANNDLMRESATDPGTNRAAISIASVTGSSASTDNISDLIAAGNILDDTTPPLFCGGTAGTSTRGPNGLVVQPKGRAILLTENGGVGFDSIEDLGSNAVIRVTLPAGWDLNNYNGSLTASEIVAIETSGGLTAAITRIQEITSSETGAFIDIGSVNSSTTTVAINRMLGVFFRPHALLVPDGTTDFTATISVVNTKATTASSDDETISSLGTVELASGCSTFLTVAFCPDALSDFNDTSITTPANASVESIKVTRGARETTFASAIGPALRLVESTPEEITLPDLCITEGVADAFPLGSTTSAGVTGVPTIFGDVTNTTVTVHIATSFPGDSSTGDVGINGETAATSILFSDTSIEAGSAVNSVSDNEVQFTINTRTFTGNQFPFEETTRIRVPGLRLSAPTAVKSFSDQDLIVWVETADGNEEVVIGSSLAAGLSEVTASTNEYFLGAFSAGSGDVGDKMRNLFATKVKDTVTNAPTDTNWADQTAGGDNQVTVALAGGDPATLSDVTRTEVDSASNFLELDGDTKISVLTSEISGVTSAVNALVSVAPGTLEPGTRVAVDGTIDDVTVPVLADGSFQANIRCAAGTSINLTQTPDSGAITTPALGSATCEDANVEPILLSATFVDSGLGTLTARGSAPVVFQVVASGKLDGNDFIPTADQLTLGGNPVTAVSGTTDKFIGIVDFAKSSGKVVATTAGDGSSVTLGSITSSNPTLGGAAPTLVKARLNKQGTKVVLRGLRLGNKGLAHFILDDGSASALDLVNRNSKDAQLGRRRGEVGTTVPSNATHAVFHIPGQGMAALEL